MSDTTEATAPPATAPVREGGMAETPTSTRSRIPARDLVRLAQGFYFIFWGLLLAVVMGTQLLIALELYAVTELLLAAGVVATLVGSWRLYQARSISPLWRTRAGWTLALALLMTYFCVFFYMWRRIPANVYLLANALAFLGTSIVYMIMLSRAVAALAVVLDRRELLLESRVFSISNVGFLLVPFVGTLIYIGIMSALRRSDLLFEFQYLLARSNLVVVILLLLPFSLTLSLAWVAKDATLKELTTLDHP
jgi:hypothetical protein